MSDGYQYILVADDDPAILRLVKALVESEGYVAVTVADGKAAYNALNSGSMIHAAIVDVGLPYIQGTDLVKFMRSDERFRNIPVIVMTAAQDPKLPKVSMQAGAVAFLPKPFSNSQLKLILSTFVPKARSGSGK